MDPFDFDLFVIGAGSGGVRTARVAAGFGAKVAIAEDLYFGGTCVNVGCVPKKLFVYASHFSEEFRHASGFGWKLDQTQFRWQKLLANKNHEIKRLNGIYQNLLENSGVEIFDDRASLVDGHSVSISGKNYRAKYILIATGGWPHIPNLSGKEYVISSNDAFFLEKLPERVIIVGGGYIAVEFAGIFKGLGVATTLVYRGPLFLRGFDDEIRQCLAAEMEKKGINLKFDTNIQCIKQSPRGLTAELTDGTIEESDVIMYATGRTPNTNGLNLETIGVETNKKGAIVVNEHYQTTVPSIYAIGDVTDRVNLTPVALAEGTAVANSLFDNSPSAVDYQNIPSCVFSQPNIGTVGLTEEQARQRYESIDVYRSHFTPLKHTLSGNNEKTLMKMIVDKTNDKVLGVHMVGSDAGEIIQGIAIALKAGATKSIFDATIGIHPTAAEEFVTMRQPS